MASQETKEKSYRKETTGEKRKLTNSPSSKPSGEEMLEIRVSKPGEGPILAQFSISATDALALFLNKVVITPSKPAGNMRNKKLAASLIEAKGMIPRFESAQELFDGLEKALRN